MPRGDMQRVRDANLRLGAALSEVEGLYTALLRTGSSRRRERLLTELARAAGRLAVLAEAPAPEVPSARGGPRGSRRARRRVLAERGAAWIIARYGRSG
ncbi:hypothetical protein [Streptomyces sp. cg40]|uniref:hypothetical protein n=1 Tax=Streptomyces sp. cg40 TaxID=3419764 RepID=UPI003D060903